MRDEKKKTEEDVPDDCICRTESNKVDQHVNGSQLEECLMNAHGEPFSDEEAFRIIREDLRKGTK